MEKIIKLTELRELNKKVSKGEISALQMVEEINEKAFKVYVQKMEKLFEELKHYQAINENKKAFIENLENKMEKTKKQTAVEWLVSQLYRYSFNQPIDLGVWDELRDLAEKAKEMESNLIEQLETKIEDLTAENQSYERELNEKLINENHAFHFYRMGKFSGEVSFDRHYKEYLNEVNNEIDKK